MGVTKIKPIEYPKKVTNEYINKEFNKYNFLLDENSIEFLKGKLKETLINKKLYLKDIKAVNLTVVISSTEKIIWEIAVYTKSCYFTIQS